MALSQNEKVRAAIEAALDDKKDLTLRSTRTELVNSYIKKHPADSPGSVRSAFSKQFKVIAKDKGIPAEKMTGPKHVKAKFNPSLNATVNAKPADVNADPATKATVAQPGQPQPGQPGAAPIVYTAEAVGEMFSGLIETVRLPIPEIEPLGDGQKNALGNLWLAPVNKFLTTHERAALVFMLITTAGILGGHILNGVKKHREAKENKKEYQKEKQQAHNEDGGKPPEEATPQPAPQGKPLLPEETAPENISKVAAEK